MTHKKKEEEEVKYEEKKHLLNHDVEDQYLQQLKAIKSKEKKKI